MLSWRRKKLPFRRFELTCWELLGLLFKLPLEFLLKLLVYLLLELLLKLLLKLTLWAWLKTFRRLPRKLLRPSRESLWRLTRKFSSPELLELLFEDLFPLFV